MAKVDSTSKSFYVYVHRRATDGRVFYVGKGRGNRHKSTQRNQYWKNIVAKHGYTIEIVQDNMLEWWAFELEIELIASYGRENLANCTDGGDGCSGAVRSAESRLKTSISNTGNKRPDMTGKNAIMYRPGVAEKVSKAKKGKPNLFITGDKNPSCKPEVRIKRSLQMRGVPKTEDHRKKISITNTGKKFPERSGEFNKSSRKVTCIETNVTYVCIRHALLWLKSLGFNKACDASITRACTGKFKTAHGFTWKYA